MHVSALGVHGIDGMQLPSRRWIHALGVHGIDGMQLPSRRRIHALGVHRRHATAVLRRRIHACHRACTA